jgi:hypothetical protein
MWALQGGWALKGGSGRRVDLQELGGWAKYRPRLPSAGVRFRFWRLVVSEGAWDGLDLLALREWAKYRPRLPSALVVFESFGKGC